MAKIVIVGSGVVGTATGKGLAHRGHDVTFVDIDPNRLRRCAPTVTPPSTASNCPASPPPSP